MCAGIVVRIVAVRANFALVTENTMRPKSIVGALLGVGILGSAVGGLAPRVVAASGDVTTFAGGPPPTSAGFADGTGLAARFDNPKGLARDAVGNVYIADYGNNRIRKMTPAGVVSTVGGSGAVGTANGPAATATFDRPRAVATDGTAVFVTEDGSNRIRMIAGGQVSDFAGGAAGIVDGPLSTARFDHPLALAWEAGSLYVEDYYTVRRLTAGVATTLLGCVGPTQDRFVVEKSPTGNCPRNSYAMLSTSNGSLYFTDHSTGFEELRRFDPSGGTSTVCPAGQHAALFRPGQLPQSMSDLGLTSIPLYSASSGNISSAAPVVSFTLSITHPRDADLALRLRAPDGRSVPLILNRGPNGGNFTTTTFVSSGFPSIGTGSPPFSGKFLPEQGSFSPLQGASVTAGTPWFLDVTDSGSGTIGTVTALDLMVCADGSAPLLTDIATAGLVQFGGLATAADGTLYWSFVGSTFSKIMRKVGAVIDEFTGPGGLASTPGFVDGPRLQARFRSPVGVVIGSDGSLLIADGGSGGNNVIRRIDLSAPDTIAPTGVITSPASAGQVYPSKPITFSGTASDNVGVASVAVTIERIMSVFDFWNGNGWQPNLVYLPAAGVTTGPVTNWTYSFNPPQSGGRYYVSIRVTDAAGNQWTSGGRDFLLPDSTPPTATFTGPLNGSTVAAGSTVTVTGIASDNSAVYSVPISIQRVSDGTFYDGFTWATIAWPTTTKQIATLLSAPGAATTNWSRSFVPPTPGAYIITSRPYDGNDNQTVVSITITAI